MGTKPLDFSGSFDDHVDALCESIQKCLLKAQKGFIYDSLRLPKSDVSELAEILAGFAEDVHCGIGIWAAYERINRRLFGTPLPLIISPLDAQDADPGLYLRLRHLLWVIYPKFQPRLLLSPGHADLAHLAQQVADLLAKLLDPLPKQSSVNACLSAPNRWGWDVKRKLVWLGTESYLFRPLYERAGKDKADEDHNEIDTTDDFICQECTPWSGLGAVDILAEQQALTGERRTELLSWTERHHAPYRVTRVGTDVTQVLNLVNDQPYTVRVNVDPNPFTEGMVVIGALAPWSGEWYWSGQQRVLDTYVPSEELKQLYLQKSASITYRYCPDRLVKARGMAARNHAEFVKTHGNDHCFFANGYRMAADWQAVAKQRFEALPATQQAEFLRKHGLRSYKASVSIPPDLLECNDGICVFSTPEKGVEIMRGFNDVLSGLRKKGQGLTQDECESLRGWVESPSISPAFVRRFVPEHGAQSILETYMLAKSGEAYAFDYLLRRYKGKFYRTQYPSITIVE